MGLNSNWKDVRTGPWHDAGEFADPAFIPDKPSKANITTSMQKKYVLLQIVRNLTVCDHQRGQAAENKQI